MGTCLGMLGNVFPQQRKFGVFSHPKNKISSNFPGTGSQARLPGTIPKPGSQEQVPRQGSQARVPETVAKQGSQEQVSKQGSQEQVSKKRLQKSLKGFQE